MPHREAVEDSSDVAQRRWRNREAVEDSSDVSWRNKRTVAMSPEAVKEQRGGRGQQ
jgi:hypothetical protein